MLSTSIPSSVNLFNINFESEFACEFFKINFDFGTNLKIFDQILITFELIFVKLLKLPKVI